MNVKAKNAFARPHNSRSGASINSMVFIVAIKTICSAALNRFRMPLKIHAAIPVDKEVLVIEGVRENWLPSPLKVLSYRFSFLDNMKLTEIRLANAFIIENIPYHWKKGNIEPWKKEEDFKAF